MRKVVDGLSIFSNNIRHYFYDKSILTRNRSYAFSEKQTSFMKNISSEILVRRIFLLRVRLLLVGKKIRNRLEIDIRDHPFSKFAKCSKKRMFLTP